MKRKNFPWRKNKRRSEAIQRINDKYKGMMPYQIRMVYNQTLVKIDKHNS
jgi:hypothetical protein